MAESISAPRGSLFLRVLWYWVPVVIAVGVMYYFSTDVLSNSHTRSVIDRIVLRFMPHASYHTLGLFNHFIRKFAHFFEYSVLALLLFRAFRGDGQVRWHIRWAFYSFACTAVWALLDEYHQSFTRSREASIWDVLLDCSGSFIALTIIAIYYTKRDRKTRLSWTRGSSTKKE